MAAILPLAETVLLGAADGALRAVDNKKGRNTTLKQWSTYLEAGLVVAGGLAAMQRVHPDWWEPMVVGGLFALSQRAGTWGSHQAGVGGPDLGGDAYGGYGGRTAPAAPARPGQAAMGWGYRPFRGPDPSPVPVTLPPRQHLLPP